MTPPSRPRLRILILWGASHFEDYLADLLLENPDYEIEIVSGHRSSKRSPHAATLGRLWQLRGKLVRGEFDLVISGPIQNSPWPRPRRLATCLAQALRFFTYKRGMLDSYWTWWLLAGKVRGKVPLAVIDFLDTSFVLPRDFPLLQAATLYFKLNLYFWPRRSLLPLEVLFSKKRVIPLCAKLRPLTNGVPKRRIPAQSRPMRDRDIDLCFTGTIVPYRSAEDIDPFLDFTSNPIRRDIYERCLKLRKLYHVYCFNGMVSDEAYPELLQRSKLVVCTESFGCETFRHYDVAAAGAIPLVNWPYVTNYKPLEPDRHAFYFSLFGDDFERTVERALSDPDHLEQMSHDTRAFTTEFKERSQVGKMIVEETLWEHARLRHTLNPEE